MAEAIRILSSRARARLREKCPLCWGSLRAETHLTCDGCSTPHHSACFQELGGCATLGCDGLDRTAPTAPPPTLEAPPSLLRMIADAVSVLLAGAFSVTCVALLVLVLYAAFMNLLGAR